MEEAALLTVVAGSPLSASGLRRRTAIEMFLTLGMTLTPPLGGIPISFVDPGGDKTSQIHSGNVPVEYSSNPVMIGIDGSKIEARRLGGSVGIRCTGSAGEVGKGPLASGIIGRKPVSSF